MVRTDDLPKPGEPAEIGETVIAGEINLRDCFEIPQPGRYKLTIHFADPSGYHGDVGPTFVEIPAN